jgi:threonine/homoserine efflux transporter RhtA
MYALVAECDDDHGRTHRALAYVANAEHLPVGKSIAIIIVGQLRLSVQKMRNLVGNWVGLCNQVLIFLCIGSTNFATE